MEKTKKIFNQGYIVTKAHKPTITSCMYVLIKLCENKHSFNITIVESAKSLLMYKTMKKEKKRRVKGEKTIVPIEEYIMSEDMLLKHKFPHPSYTDQEGNSMDFSEFVHTTNTGMYVYMCICKFECDN